MSALVGALWHGEVRLWITYWIWGVGGNMAFVAVLVALWLLGAERDGGQDWLWLAYLLSLAWFVLIFGAIWRSAGRYAGPRLWPALARLGVMVGIVRMAAEAVLLTLI